MYPVNIPDVTEYVRYKRRIKLDDGYEISIICNHDVSYGHANRLFECAMILPDEDIDHDSVTGYLDFDQVAEYIKKAKEIHNERHHNEYKDSSGFSTYVQCTRNAPLGTTLLPHEECI